MSAALFLPARAKVNLSLRIVGRRPDGYHLLETLFRTLSLHDDVVVRAVDGDAVGIDVTADAPELQVPADGRNLAARALVLLRDAVRAATGSAPGLHVHVHKRIPNGAGLGGGSSNAAAALVLGNQLLGGPLAAPALHELAVQLGADVPFFLRGGCQWGRGIGDELEPVTPSSGPGPDSSPPATLASPAASISPTPPPPGRGGDIDFVLLLPPYGCNTVAVYKMYAELWRADSSGDTVRGNTVSENLAAGRAGLGEGDDGSAVQTGSNHNDLERAAMQLRPELRRLRDAAAASAGPADPASGGIRARVRDALDVRMSGSGSTLFVPIAGPDAQARRRAAEHCRDAIAAKLVAADDGEHAGTRLLVTGCGPPVDGDTPLARP
ncbi:MAG: 4-(cytidine 5'-diphospho)-2-C-methyl-D-erythritol kinase [Planctomycetota bacterium]